MYFWTILRNGPGLEKRLIAPVKSLLSVFTPTLAPASRPLDTIFLEIDLVAAFKTQRNAPGKVRFTFLFTLSGQEGRAFLRNVLVAVFPMVRTIFVSTLPKTGSLALLIIASSFSLPVAA